MCFTLNATRNRIILYENEPLKTKFTTTTTKTSIYSKWKKFQCYPSSEFTIRKQFSEYVVTCLVAIKIYKNKRCIRGALSNIHINTRYT